LVTLSNVTVAMATLLNALADVIAGPCIRPPKRTRTDPVRALRKGRIIVAVRTRPRQPRGPATGRRPVLIWV
jgi:hypothetical protein